jgi:hypothetical protein
MSKTRLAFFVVLSLFLFLNLLTMSDYGLTWDEPTQQLIGQAGLDRILGRNPGADFMSQDLIYYGPFFEISNLLFGKELQKLGVNPIEANHVLILLTAALGIYFFFCLAGLMFGERIALIASVALALWPRFLAHAHYNSKDIPMLAGVMAILFFLYSGFSRHKFTHIVWAGLAFGLTMATRLDALFVLPIFFLPYVFHQIWESKLGQLQGWRMELKRDLFKLIVFLAIGAAVLFVAWPGLWGNPNLFFQAIRFFFHHHWPGRVLYFGEFYTASTLPWHYSLFYLTAVVPIAVLVLAMIGAWLLAFRRRRKSDCILPASLVFTWLLLRLAVDCFPGVVRYDGSRHFMFVFPALMLLAALGFDVFWQKLWGKTWQQRMAAIAVAAGLFISLAAEMIVVYPFGDSYFNEAVRARYPAHLEANFELDNWGSSLQPGIDWLNRNAKSNASFCAPIAGHLVRNFQLRPDLAPNCSSNPDYLIFFTRFSFLPADLAQTWQLDTKTPVYKISRLHSDLLYIYQQNP